MAANGTCEGNRYASWAREVGHSWCRHGERSAGGLSAGALRAAENAATAPWQFAHEQLLSIAKRRGALDAEEARWLHEAERLQVWKPFAMVNMVDYLERVVGYAPRTAQERLRVARALANLPELTDALRTGELPHSAIKELARVATPATERAWREAAREKNVRQIEELVRGHRPGDRPEDPAEEDARLHTVVFEEVSASVYAMVRQARLALQEQHGSRMTDNDVLGAFASLVLGAAHVGAEPTTPTRPVQLCLTVCRVCDRAWQQGAGALVPITEEALEQARCDAQHIGDVHADHPERAHTDIPPATRRLVEARDQGRCQTPGCRSTLGLELHHIIPRFEGGTHDPRNLTTRCFACHQARHEGRLEITGTAPDNIVTRRVLDARRSTAPSKTPLDTYAAAVRRTEALAAMRALGWNSAEARRAVDAAIAGLDRDAPLEAILREALGHCAR